MSSLAALLARSRPLLALDAASSRIQVGLWLPTRGWRWQSSETESGTGLFLCTDALLREAKVAVADLGTIIFCEGPGSVLGIRTSAMAIRTWQLLAPTVDVFAYRSLALLAEHRHDAALSIICDARRDAWHVARLGQPLVRTATAALTGPLATPTGFRNWTPLPPNTAALPYEVSALLDATADRDLLHAAPQPDAFLHEDPTYATWTPHVHQAPAR